MINNEFARKNSQLVHHSESDKKVVLYDASLIAYNWHQHQGRRGNYILVSIIF